MLNWVEKSFITSDPDFSLSSLGIYNYLVYNYTVKKSVGFTAKYLASGCKFFYRYFYGRLPVEHF